MKRYGYLFEKIISIENLYIAEKKARKGKKSRKEIISYVENLDKNILELHNSLKDRSYVVSEYRNFIIYEPKPRNISALPYKDRIIHQAVILVLETIFVRSFISTTYSCIKKRGIHLGLKNLNRSLKDKENSEYCLKTDISKFYPSVDNTILKQQLRTKFKDLNLLWLLDLIIDSIKGLPLGSYTSQFFANFYINRFLHWLKENRRIKYLFVYCDDIIILKNCKKFLHNLRKEIQDYLKINLNLELSNYQVFPIKSRGIDYLGYKSFHTHILLRKSIKKSFIKMINKYLNKKSIASYWGWICHSNSLHLWNKYVKYDTLGK